MAATMSVGARIAMALFTLGVVTNFIETWCFGWHWAEGVTARGEYVWDAISSIMILMGAIMGIYYRWWGG
jgi:surface polysaccharide O-acyltransferase-like enzyme